uniref:NADH dehydrogenase subunit 4L n=1 Tax=Dendroctonus valens TaxID=77173 RepID=UPI001FAF68D3|nr:NADH dehydrogenase subunit 4L [Dendroctonus valens]ULD67713.1 NADH dehydrogenase subunit 4L [Dendroctonus valens]
MYSLVLLFLSGLLVFILKYNHFLIMLMSLEFMVLSIYISLFFYCNYFSYESFISMFYLTFSVCESALGLSLLVLLIRTYGSDMLVIFDSLW